MSGFQSEAQQQLGGDESHNDLLGLLLRFQAELETLGGPIKIKKVTAAEGGGGVVAGGQDTTGLPPKTDGSG